MKLKRKCGFAFGCCLFCGLYPPFQYYFGKSEFVNMATKMATAPEIDQPPTYNEAMGLYDEPNYGGQLTFVDFMPNCCDRGGFFSSPIFEPFNVLIDRANDWLGSHPEWKVQTCESVEFAPRRSSKVDTQKMIYIESGESTTWYIRGLRLWCVPQDLNQSRCQQIGYFNLVPETTKIRIFGQASFESLNEVLEKFNSSLSTTPLYGYILNIESQEMKLKSFSDFKPDRTYWSESGDFQKHFLIVLRVFYAVSSDVMESIGVTDFLPEKLENAGVFSSPKYEIFSDVVKRASDWCRMQTHIRICSVQSMEVKIKSGGKLDSRIMSYTESGSVTTSYARIIRVVYTSFQGYYDVNHIAELSCKTFVPLQLAEGIFMPDFETLDQTKKRVEAWVRATGARVISAETSALRLFTGGEARYGIETTYTYNTSGRLEYWIFTIRLYLNGTYPEPPSHLLPPVQPIRSIDCCSIV